MIQSTSSDQAKAYFSESLAKADYYINDQELSGKFEGKLVERLGLSEKATREQFFKLAENIHPQTKESLTPRTKENRRVGYDINFHCPKSVSVLHALSKDKHLMEAFEKSVSETMLDIQNDAQGRIRKGKKTEDRNTGELVWASFTHQTARPVEGNAPDPHLHAHCFVFNVTWDEAEKQFKAGQFGNIKRDMPYYQARFHKRLADKLQDLGYQVKRTEKSFEVEGVPQKVIDLFSKRTDEIGRIAKEKGIEDPTKLDELGARTRSKKQKGLSMTELREDWKNQIRALGEDESEGQKTVRFAPKKELDKTTAKECIDHAINHSFERASVMADRKLLIPAYRYGLGNSHLELDAIDQSLKQDARIITVKEKGRSVMTTRAVLAEEKRMVQLAKDGMGKMHPLYREETLPELTLKGQQAEAVKHILTSPHRVSIVRGAAGSGKTTLMTSAVNLMEARGKRVTVVAPTSQASRGVLREEGFEAAETVASLLKNTKLQDELQGQVLWVDEAGLLGTKDMTDLLELATRKNARLILGGDTRQHASVVRGDALRILNTVAGIKSAEVTKIYRQRNVDYKMVVESLAEGNVKDGFERLDKLQAIKSVDPLKPNVELVEDYVAAVKKGKTALVVSPTHKQGEEVTAAIRERLRMEGLLGKRELVADRWINLNLTKAQKQDFKNLEKGHWVQFNQNRKGIKRGSLWEITESDPDEIQLKNKEGQIEKIKKLSDADFDVFAKSTIHLAKGDKVHVTRNGFDENKQRLNNGQNLEVLSVRKSGSIILRNPVSKKEYTLDQNFGHLSHAHCITSYAAQGKTVDEVFISQPAGTFAASDAKQFYVSVSRGRDMARIYTDDKEALLGYVFELGDRQSAIELVQHQNERHLDHVRIQEREKQNRVPEAHAPLPTLTKQEKPKDRDYEPGL